MRFHRGEFPDDNRFDPEAEGWVALPETKLGAVHFLALRASVGLFLLWLPLTFLAFPIELLFPHVTKISPTQFQIQIPIYETVSYS